MRTLYGGTRNKSLIKKDAVPTLFLHEPGSSASNKESFKHQEQLNLKEEMAVLPPQVLPSSPIPSTSAVVQTPSPKSNYKTSTPAKVANLRKRVNLLARSHTRNISDLTPKTKKYYRIASDLRRTAIRLDLNRIDLRERLKNMEDVTTSAGFLKAKLNKQTYEFVLSQLRCHLYYSLNEKIFFYHC
ncbi:uncharacterized protein LOC115885686 [Sitophilus oryzae]|uniref:Uncharacterized protein LOC115885686 n=1 Tax=Sitophilus oryzae TaxID=7048 RepID=A0A6J2YC92_SITOR|nr:uncharacterized protein LOC115885686 [Sitophilus oryzae]